MIGDEQTAAIGGSGQRRMPRASSVGIDQRLFSVLPNQHELRGAAETLAVLRDGATTLAPMHSTSPCSPCRTIALRTGVTAFSMADDLTQADQYLTDVHDLPDASRRVGRAVAGAHS